MKKHNVTTEIILGTTFILVLGTVMAIILNVCEKYNII